MTLPTAPIANSYSLQEISSHTGLSERTLRFYMQKSLLPSPGRTGAGTRYPEDILHRALVICKMKEEDASLSEIEQRLNTLSGEQLKAEAQAYLQARVEQRQTAPPLPRPVTAGIHPKFLMGNAQTWQHYQHPDAAWFELQVRDPSPDLEPRRIHNAIRQLGLPEHLPAGQGILLLTADDVMYRQLQTVRSLFSEAGGENFLGGISLMRADAKLAAILGENGPLSRRHENELVDYIENQYPAWAVRGVIHKRQLNDNWFSRWHVDMATFVASLAGWEDLCATRGLAEQAVPLQSAYLANALLLYGLYTQSRYYEQHDLFHEETRGCLFDFCATKTDILVKLENANLCPTCQTGLENLGMDTAPVEAMLDIIRHLGTRTIRQP
ncbi:MAG: Family ership [Pseudomonadota bacterium]